MADLPDLPSEDIRRLLVEYRGTPFEPRLRALSYLAAKPDASRAEAARYAGISERSLRRYIERVREGGIEGVIDNGRLGRNL